MQESSSLSDAEKASWLDLPDPWLRDSWKKRNEYPDLMDGAYFGLNWDPILDTREKIFPWPTWCIVIHNPWLRKRSLLMPDVFAGRILTALDTDGVPNEAITFPEAVNKWWIQEKPYLDAWRYLGKDTMTMQNRIWVAQGFVPSTVYQLTKKDVQKVAITERDVRRPNILYFFGLWPRI